jgi:hypothetical protein
VSVREGDISAANEQGFVTPSRSLSNTEEKNERWLTALGENVEKETVVAMETRIS